MVTEHTMSHGFYVLLTDKARTYDKIRKAYDSDMTDDEKADAIMSIIADSINLI